MMWALSMLLAPAMAQDTFSGRGPLPVASDQDLQDPIFLWRADSPRAGTFGAGLLFEHAESPLVLYTEEGGEVQEQVLLDNLSALHLQIAGSVHSRVGLSLEMPLYLSTAGLEGAQGGGLGDARLAASVGLSRREDEAPLALSLIPYIDLPSGTDSDFLGNSGVGGGAVVAAGAGGTRWDAGANLGVSGSPAVEVENVTGGASFLAGAAAALLINPEHALRAELRMDAPLTEAEDLPKSDLPAEAVLSARGRYASGLVWTLGGASGLTRGPGTASWRLFAGLSYARSGPEPVLRSDLEVQVVDPEGRPIPGARVSGNSGELLTATDGWTSWEDLLAGQAFEVVASHPDYNENRARVAIGGDDQKLRIALAPRMSALAVDVTNQDGQPVDARIEFLGGPVHRDAMQVGPDGKEHIVVPAGGWEIIAVAEGYAPRSARIDLKAGQTGVAALTLSPSRVVVKQDSIQILDKVYFDLDKATLKPESFPILEEVANTLKLHPEIRRVEVAGHTDSRGSDQYNLELSDARVNTVRLFLITQGVDASRLTSRGYGESRPIDPREDEDGWARNRRVEFVILERSP